MVLVVVFLYIDPGAGSMVIQAVLAALLAVPFFLRTQIGRAVDRFRGRSSRSNEDSSTDV